MSVYVDDVRLSYGRMVMCHMVADTTEELLTMATRIGLQRKWLQHRGTDHEHFDVSLAMRTKAVVAGAIEVDRRALVRVLLERRKREEDAVFDAIEAGEANGISIQEEHSFSMSDWGD